MNISLKNSIAMLPLRLEIRKITLQDNGKVNIAKYNTNSGAFANPYGSIELRHEETSLSINNSEYWIRWYPDESLLLNPVGRITPTEYKLWKNFNTIIQDLGKITTSLSFADFADKKVEEAWSYFCKKIGNPVRATHIFKFHKWGNSWNFDTEISEKIFEINNINLQYEYSENKLSVELRNVFKSNNIILSDNIIIIPNTNNTVPFLEIEDSDNKSIYKIQNDITDANKYVVHRCISDPFEIYQRGVELSSFPDTISLYTINDNEGNRIAKATPLVTGININKNNVLVSSFDLEGSKWITDFKSAVERGMGTIISEPAKVTQLENSDWLIAFGVNESERSHEILEDLFKRNNVNGDISILPQDIPTNNTEDTRTPYKVNEEDPLKYAKDTILVEESETDRDSLKLSKAFGFDKTVFEGIIGSDLNEMNYTDDMANILWDACTSEFYKYWKSQNVLELNPLEWINLKEFFAKFVKGRGLLPAIRIGKNPYGVIPVSSSRLPINEGVSIPKVLLEDKLYNVLLSIKKVYLDIASGIKTINPYSSNSGDEFNLLIDILSNERVSKKINVRKIKKSFLNVSTDPANLACPLVKEKPPVNNNAYRDSDDTYYLEYLCVYLTGIITNRPLRGDSSANFFNNNFNFEEDEVLSIKEDSALLKRIIYLNLKEIKAEYIKALGGRDINTSRALSIALEKLSKIKEASENLSKLSTNDLELLFLETWDLFSYRLDAWITGISAMALEEVSDNLKPYLGVYGLIEKPGMISTSAPDNKTNCYLQGPDESKTVTAAILRNAVLDVNTQDNNKADTIPLMLDLSSGQIRKALLYFGGLRKGHTPGELLGYVLERMIKDDNINQTIIYVLRKAYPLSISQDDTAIVSTVIDGLRFVDDFDNISTNQILTPAEKNEITIYKNQLVKLKTKLIEIKDAAADLAIAETTYQFINGNMEASAAWMDFLDGECLPPEPQFIKTDRTGQRHATKVFLMHTYTQEEEADQENIFKILDPVYNSFCKKWLSGINEAKISFNVYYDGINDSIKIENIHIVSDLKISPIDFVVEGKENLLIKLKYFVLKIWASENSNNISDNFGTYPNNENFIEILSKLKITIDPGSIDEYLKKSQLINKLIEGNHTANRGLAIFDDNLSILEKDILCDLDYYAIYDDLISRGTGTKKLINGIIGNNGIMGNITVLLDVLDIDNNYTNDQISDLIVSNLDSINVVFEKVSKIIKNYTQPLITSNATTKNVLQYIVDSLKVYKEELILILEELDTLIKENMLLNNSGEKREYYSANIVNYVKSLSGILNIKNLPFLLKYKLKDNLKWLVNYPPTTEYDTFIKYINVRNNVKVLNELKDKILPTPPLCFTDNFINKTGNTSFYYLAESKIELDIMTYLYVDSWNEFYPDNFQNTAVSFHYESPKNEAPNLIILAQHSFKSAGVNRGEKWSEDIIADTILEALELMKIRAVSSSDVLKHPVLGKIFPMSYFKYDIRDPKFFPTIEKKFSDIGQVSNNHNNNNT